MSINLLYNGFTGAGPDIGLTDKFQLPLVSNPYDLPDWHRDLTEEEYLQIIGPPDLAVLMNKHGFLKMQLLSWQRNEHHYRQIETVIDLLSEFDRGNKPVRYTLTISDMG